MANAHIHSVSSARKFGGQLEDYLEIHIKMDCSKAYFSSNIHRALTHHTFWIHEVMIPTEGNEPHEHGDANYIVVAQDDETEEFLVLWVELHGEDDGYTYSYFFNIMDNNGKIGNRFYTRAETAKYLPMEIKSTIIPLVKKMTINLVNRIQPNIINRKATEFLTQKGMERYDEISKLLQDELGYTLIEQGKNEEGKESWKFQKNGVETELNEDTIGFFYTFNEERWVKSMEKAHLKLIESIKKKPLILGNNKNN